jgi:hypothetical protein
MIARGFKPVGWVAAVAGAALGCYMLSLNVAAERAELASVERQIVAAKQDIRALQTELGTRGRMAQLEHWNAEVLALSAPASNQFLQNEFRLASLNQPLPTIDERAAQVRMASADSAPAQPGPKAAVARQFEAVDSAQGKPLVRRASLVINGDEASLRPRAVSRTIDPQPTTIRPIAAKPAPTKPALTKSAAARPAPPKKAALIDEDLLGEIGAAARLEKKAGGAGGQ